MPFCQIKDHCWGNIESSRVLGTFFFMHVLLFSLALPSTIEPNRILKTLHKVVVYESIKRIRFDYICTWNETILNACNSLELKKIGLPLVHD